MPPEAAREGPIADVSYRNYDGPLRQHPLRWWIIARTSAQIAFRRKGFWVLAVMAALPYLFPGFQLYLKSRIPDQLTAFLGERSFPSYFYDAFAQAQLWVFLTALLVGAASIAGDNRTNALQIYLSKPLTKGDYLLGKWMGIFLIVGAVSILPALVLFLYCLGSFQDQGFVKDYPWLWLQLLACTVLPAAFHSSLLLGFSSGFKRPVLAGGLYAGMYFGTFILAPICGAILRRSSGSMNHVWTVMHLSIPGIVRGIAQHLLNTLPTFFGLPIGRGEVQKPNLAVLLIVGAALMAIALVVARLRVKAVEVVRG